VETAVSSPVNAEAVKRRVIRLIFANVLEYMIFLGLVIIKLFSAYIYD
jgi:hypothetical protein